MSDYIIYKITNKINNMVYIGQTTHSIEKRWKEHLASRYSKKKHYFVNSLRKYWIAIYRENLIG